MTQRGASAGQADAETLRPISAESPWHSANRTDAAKQRDSNPALRDVPKLSALKGRP